MSVDLKPSVREMLEIGDGCGLSMIDEAYSNYINHYTCFFYIPEYLKQHAELVDELTTLGFVVQEEDGKRLIELSIHAALEKLNAGTPSETSANKEI